MPHHRPRRRAPSVVSSVVLILVLGGCAMDGPRELMVTPSHVTLSEITSTRLVTVGFSGPMGANLDITAVAGDPRVTVEPPVFRLAAGQTRAVAVQASMDDVGTTFSSTVRFTAPGVEAAVVTVSLAPGCFIEPHGSMPSSSPEGTTTATRTEAATGLAYVPGQLLVTYRDPPAPRPGGVGRAAADRLAVAMDVAAAAGAEVLRAGSGHGHDLLAVPEAELDATVARLQLDPRVESVSRNYLATRLQAAVADARYPAQWHLYDFGAEEAWEAETADGGGDPVVIAIVDDGVNVVHLNLAAKTLPGRDVFCDDDDVRAISPHGSHVAAIAAAQSVPEGVVVGVARGERVVVLPVKVFPDNLDMSGTLDSVNRGLRFAGGLDGQAGVRADVINLSLGFGSSLPAAATAILQSTVDQLHALGTTVVAASGNAYSGAGVAYPARLEHVIAVGAVDWETWRSAFSNYGPGLDLMAPGGSAPTTALIPDQHCRNAGGIGPTRIAIASAGASGDRAVMCFTGTSMAAPFVSGTIALLIAHDGTFRDQPDAILARLVATAHQPPGYAPDEYGAGLVCPDAVLEVGTVCGQ